MLVFIDLLREAEAEIVAAKAKLAEATPRRPRAARRRAAKA
jgi:hypothetical protein